MCQQTVACGPNLTHGLSLNNSEAEKNFYIFQVLLNTKKGGREDNLIMTFLHCRSDLQGKLWILKEILLYKRRMF